MWFTQFSGLSERTRRGARLRGPGLALTLALAPLVALSGCAGSSAPTAAATTTSTTTPSGPAATATSATNATTAPGGYAVLVYFARHPDTDNDPSQVYPVVRTSPTLGVATYALAQLLAGPTAAEQGAGYYTPWAGALSGASNCGADFTITIDHRGAAPAPGVATVQFCRATQIAGELAGARMTATAQATLLQFANIHSVVLLNASGGCFDDLKGANACLAG